MGNNDFQFLMQLAIDTSEAVGKLQTAWRQIEQYAEKQTIEMNIEPTLDTQALTQKVNQIKERLGQVSTAIQQAEKEMEGLTKEAGDAARELEQRIPKAAERIKTAFKESSEAATKEIAKITEELKGATNPQLLKRFEDAADQMSAKVLKTVRQRFGEAFSPDKYIAELVAGGVKAEQQISRLKKKMGATPSDSAEYDEIVRKIKSAQERAQKFQASLSEAFGGNVGKMKEAVDAFQALQQGAKESSKGVESASKHLTKFLTVLERTTKDGSGIKKLRTEAEELAAALNSAEKALEKGASRTAGSRNGLKLSLDIPYLVTQIDKAFEPTYKLKLDRAFLEEQLKGILVGTQVGAQTVAAAATAGTARSAPNPTLRGKTRVELARNASGYISGIAPGAAAHLAALEQIVSGSREGLSVEQLRTSRERGNAAYVAISRALNEAKLEPAQAAEIQRYLQQQYLSPLNRVGAATNQRGITSNIRTARIQSDFASRRDRFIGLANQYAAGDAGERLKLRTPLQALIGPYSRSVDAMLRNGLGSQENLTLLKEQIRLIGEELNAGRKLSEYEKQVSEEHRARMKQQTAEDKKYYKEVADAQMRYLKEEAAAEKKYQTEVAAEWMRRYREQGRIGGPRGGAGSGRGFGNTLRNLFALAGGLGVGYYAYSAIGGAMRTQMQYEQEIANIQGVLGSKNRGDAQNLGGGVASVAAKYGTDLIQAAQAAKMFAQAGMEAREVVRELDFTLAASKGMGMTIEQVQELQVAIRAVTDENEKYTRSINYTTAVLDKISAVETKYAVTSEDLASAIKRLSPLIDNFTGAVGGMNDGFDYTIALTTVLVDKLRITGEQAANVLKMMFSRITRPETLKKLQNDYGLQIADKDTGDFLPLDEMIAQMGRKYAELNPIKRKQFATELGGGRNVHAITVLLEDYARVQDIATQASNSFGDAQKRAAIGMDTLQTRVGQLKTSFVLFTKEALDSTHVADGLKATIAGLSAVFRGIAFASNAGGLAGTIGVTLAGGALFAGGRALYTFLSKTAVAARLATSASRGLLGTLTTIFTPGGLILTGALALVGVVGLLYSAYKNANEEANRYKVTLRDISSIEAAPQIALFKDTAANTGLGTTSRAYKTVSRILSTQNAGAFAPLESSLQRFSQMSDTELRKFYGKNSNELRDFQREFSRIFIQQLPQDAQESFGKMQTEGERISRVMTLVGGAAFTATYQMKAAIEDLHDATSRMMDDTMKKLAEFEEAKRNPNLLQRLNPFADPNLYDKVTALQGVGVGAVKRGLTAELFTRTLKGQPIYGALIGNNALRNYGLNQVLTPGYLSDINAGKVSYVKLLNDMLEAVNSNPQLAAQLSQALLAKTGDIKALARLSPAELDKLHLSPDQLEQIRSEKLLETVTGKAAKTGADYITSHNQDQTRAGQIARILTRAGSFGTPGVAPITGGVNGANEALVRFKDVLLDTARQIYEAVRRFNFEQEFAQRFRQAYDRGAAQVQLGRTFLNLGEDFSTSHQFDIVGLARQIEHLRTISRVDSTGKRVAKDVTKKGEFELQMGDLQKEISDFNSADLSKIFGNSGEGILLEAQFRAALKEAGLGNFDNFGSFLNRAGNNLVTGGLGIQYARKSALQGADLRKLVAGNQGQLATASLTSSDSLLKQLTVRSDVARRSHEEDLAALEVQKKQFAISDDDYKLAKEKLETEYRINEIFQSRLSLTQEQQKYDEQAKANIVNMLSGFKKTATDLSIWEQVVSPPGADAHERWKQSAMALRNILFDTVTPVFKTINDRIMENIFEKLVNNLSQMGPLKDIVNTGEYVLKGNIQGAQIHYAMTIDAFNKGSAVAYSAIVAAMSGGPMPSGASTTAPTGVTGTGATGTSGKQISGLGMAAIGAGVMLGQIGGTLVGKGGAHAQQGASIGTNVGMLGAMALGTQWGAAGGPVGMAVGAIVGGIIGGLFGGKKDDHSRQQSDPVVKGLDAIERAQRDTITTINAQTDALLKPENRFLNLPSNFNVPDYSPAGGVGGQFNVKIDLNINGSAPMDMHKPIGQQVGQAVRDALGEMLYNERRNRSRA